MNMEIMHAMLNVNLSPHLFFPLLRAWAKKLLFSTTVLPILYPRSTVHPTTKHSPGCIVLSHFLYYVLLCWLFEGAECYNHQSILLSPLNCVWWRAESANYNSVYTVTLAVSSCHYYYTICQIKKKKKSQPGRNKIHQHRPQGQHHQVQGQDVHSITSSSGKATA